jgi:serine protease Do
LKVGRSYNAVISIDGVALLRGKLIAITKRSLAVRYKKRSTISNRFVAAFKGGGSLGLSFKNGSTQSFSLYGTHAAFEKINDCAGAIIASIDDKQSPAPQKSATPNRTSSGTGFFVSSIGHLVTNAHVVDRCSQIIVGTSDNQQWIAQPILVDRTNDLALLRTSAKTADVAVLRSTARLGEAVFAFGFPLAGILSSSGNFTAGNITADAGINDDTRRFQISTPIQPGNSGGPLLDQYGNVVGVIVSKLDTRSKTFIPQNINFAIKANIVQGFLSTQQSLMMSSTARSERLLPPDIATLAKTISAIVKCKRGNDETKALYAIHTGYAMEGGDIEIIRNTSLTNCRAKCASTSACRVFSYDLWNQFCFLKSKQNALRLDPRHNTYVRQNLNVRFSRKPVNISRRLRKSFPNPGYKKIRALNFAACSEACRFDGRCNGINYYRSGSRCILIAQPTEYFDDRRTDIGLKVQEP